MKVTVPERVGQCRWCGCTDARACDAGCSWANRQHTLCSECVALDRALRTVAGRLELAEFLQEHSFLWDTRRVQPQMAGAHR
jgi:hypothetical protein